MVLDVLLTAFLYGLYRVIRLRRRERTRDGTATLAVLVGVIAIMMLMREWPYRTLRYRDLERVDFGEARCYVNGKSGNELLLLCPGAEPPRNRVVSDVPALKRLGMENVFRGVGSTSADP
jgi:hypothetical protein